MLIERKAGSEKVEISLVPGKGKLCVNEKGFELFSKEFSLASGGREIIRAKLVPLTVSPLLVAAIEIAEGKTTLAATADGRQMLVYRKASPTALKPYIQELYTPGGVQVLRDSVADHPHHHGMMFAVAANGVNFWEEQAATGRETCEGQMDVRPFDAAKSRADFLVELSGRNRTACRAQRTPRDRRLRLGRNQADPAHMANPPGNRRRAKQCCSPASGIVGWACGWWSLWTSAAGFFFNSDRTEGVFVHNSERVTPAKWCAFSSQVNGRPVTIAIFDCPKNHPAARFSPCGRSPTWRNDQLVEGAARRDIGTNRWSSATAWPSGTETSPPTTSSNVSSMDQGRRGRRNLCCCSVPDPFASRR